MKGSLLAQRCAISLENSLTVNTCVVADDGMSFATEQMSIKNLQSWLGTLFQQSAHRDRSVLFLIALLNMKQTYNTLRTTSFVDDIIFPHNGHYEFH